MPPENQRTAPPHHRTASVHVTPVVRVTKGKAHEQEDRSRSHRRSCDTDGVAVDYTTAFSDGAYRVTAVKLSGIAAACSGQNVTATLFDGTDASLAEKAGPNSGATQTLTLTSPVSAEAVEGVAVVIAG